MYSFNVPRNNIEAPNGETYVAPPASEKPKPRKLGTPPEGDHIAPDDPRIAWFWKDVARFANAQGYCSYYDQIAEKFGIPGRERDFNVSATISGITVNARIKSTSQKLADALFKEKLAAAK